MRNRLILALALALSGCSLPQPEIEVLVRGDALVFKAIMPGLWPFGGGSVDLQPDVVQVDQGGRIAWRLERREGRACTNQSGRTLPAVFPLTYGKVPRCFVEAVAAQPLTVNTTYRITATGAMEGEATGYFATDLAADTLETPPEAVYRWEDIDRSRATPGAPDAGGDAVPPSPRRP